MKAHVDVTPIAGVVRGATRRGLIVTLTAEGGRGVGEASPLPGRSRESIEEVMDWLDRIGPCVTLSAIDEMLDLPPSLELALDTARRDLLRALAGEEPAALSIDTQVLGDDLGSIQAELDALATGARSFKLKIRSRGDAARVVALRRAAPDARIRVDANRAFGSFEDVPWDLLVEARVEWIEEPSVVLPLHAPVPIALDETVEDDPARARASIAARCIAAVVLKPTLLGPRALRAMARYAREQGVRTVISHAFESDVGRRAALELAREIDPAECHGLAPWPGIGSFRPEEPSDAASPLV